RQPSPASWPTCSAHTARARPRENKMPRDINGVYTLPLPDVTTGTVTSSAWANTTLSDIALALTQSLSINGSVTPAKLTDDEAGFQTKFGVDEALATAE